jgi:hypothetical protein
MSEINKTEQINQNPIDNSYSSYLKSFFVQQGFESPQDYLRKIMSGEVTRERYDEIESKKLDKDGFIDYFYPKEKLIDFKPKGEYQKQVVGNTMIRLVNFRFYQTAM